MASALSTDYTKAAIGKADRQMLIYAEKLTRSPASITQKDVDSLRQVDFSNVAILDIAQVAAYYAFVNRIASGLGVELEAPPGKDD